MQGVLGFLSQVYNTLTSMDKVLRWFFGLTVTPWVSGGVVTSVCYAFFFGLMRRAFDKLGAVILALSGFIDASGNVNANLLDKVNYFFPVDVFATCVMIYISVWVGVQVFRFIRTAFVLASHAVEKVPFIQ